MSIVDIIIILLILAMAVFGFLKGFIKSLVSLLGFVISLALAILLANAVAGALLGIDSIGTLVAGPDGSLFSLLKGILPDGLEEITATELLAANDINALIAAETSKSAWFIKLFYPLVSSGLSSEVYLSALLNAQQIMALELAYSIYLLIVGTALFIVIRIIAAIISLVFKSLMMGKKTLPGRVLGGFIGAGKGVLYCMIMLLVISLISNFSFMQPVCSEVNESKLGAALSTASIKVTTTLTSGKNNDKHHERLLQLTGIEDNADDFLPAE